MKTCYTCRKEKPLEEYSWKSQGRGTRSSKCKECQREYGKQHYLDNSQDYKSRSTLNTVNYRKRNRLFAWNYLLGHPCVDCGEGDPRVLDFDHRDRVLKVKAVSNLVGDAVSIETLKKEIDKCTVRCANCHRKRTGADLGWWADLMPA